MKRLTVDSPKELGITRNAVGSWRRKQGLLSNREKQTAAEAPVPPAALPPSPEPSAPDPLSSTNRPLALPRARGPVDLSVELNGCAVALRAPDLEGAARVYEYAGRLLKELTEHD